MSHDRPILLLINDNANETELISEIFKNNYKHCVLYNIENISSLDNFLLKSDDYNNVKTPELIIYSTDSFKENEYKIIGEIKNNSEFKFIPIVIFTKQESADNINKYYNIYSNACIIKPDNNDEFNNLIVSIVNFWTDIVKLPIIQ